MTNIKNPHKHIELVNEWLNGALIELKCLGGKWVEVDYPDWLDAIEYRVKPKNINFPWEVIKPEYKYLGQDAFGDWYVYTTKPNWENSIFRSRGGEQQQISAIVGLPEEPTHAGTVLTRPE